MRGYIKWFYRVSHPVFSQPAPVDEYTAPAPPYEEVIVVQQWPRQVSDPLQIIDNVKSIVDSAMEVPDVFINPPFAGIMEGIQSEYCMMQEEPVPRRRTRSHSPQG